MKPLLEMKFVVARKISLAISHFISIKVFLSYSSGGFYTSLALGLKAQATRRGANFQTIWQLEGLVISPLQEIALCFPLHAQIETGSPSSVLTGPWPRALES